MKKVDERDNVLMIYTLGRFMVKRGETVLSDQSHRSYRLWELFQYLVTNRNKSFLPESIAENLWPDNTYSEPRQAVRTQICRLRKLLKDRDDNSEYITFVQGCYQWNNKQKIWIDADEFEHLYRLARIKENDNYLQAIELYRDALALYQGEYLPGSMFNEWVVPIRNYYRNLFLQCVLDFAALLQKHGRHAEIADLCEKAVLIEPYEEELHTKFMEALLAAGKVKQARVHYEYITSLLYREFGVKPSQEMLNVYKRIQAKSIAESPEIAALQEDMTEEKTDGAFICSRDVFRSIYKLERRRSERTKQAVYFGSIAPVAGGKQGLRRNRGKVMDDLENVLVKSLHRGDVVTRWDDSQFALILPGVDEQQAQSVMERIVKQFSAFHDIELKKKALPILPDE